MRFAFLVAHSLTTQASPKDTRDWWQSLQEVVQRVPRNHVLVVMIDANAQFEWCKEPPTLERALNANARALVGLLQAHNLSASPNMTPHGDHVESWLGPMRKPKCLDYEVVPTAIAAGMRTQGDLKDFEGQCDHDHRPVKVLLSWSQEGKPEAKRVSFDKKAMMTAAGRAKLRHIYDTLPPIAWDVDVDTHLRVINDHLLAGLARDFSVGPSQAKSPTISKRTWALVRDRRDIRKHLHSVKSDRSARLLSSCFQAWAGHMDRTTVADDHLGCLYEALLGRQLRDISRHIAVASKLDVVEAARQQLNDARQRGPEEFYRQVRQVLRQGRKYKPPVLKPCLDMADTGEESLLALGKHFAKAERATHAPLAELRSTALPPASSVPEVSTALSVACLTRAYAGLQTGRAAGVTGLPCEAYAGDALGAAMVHGPLLLKAQIQGVVPAHWRGGRAAPIPKPGKPPSAKEGWRSVLLHEASMKGVCRLLRRPLLQVFEQVRTKGQGGSRPGKPLQAPMAAARGFAKAARDSGAAAGILFVDARNAFYAVARQRLFGQEAGLTKETLGDIADCLFDNAEDRFAFTLAAAGPGILQECGMDSSVRRLITSMLQETWFTIQDECATHMFRTTSGTAPGSPVADVIFQIMFAGALERMEQDIRHSAQQVQAQVHSTATVAAMALLPVPSWMDDLALPIVAGTPTALIDLAVCTMQSLDREFRQLAIAVNLDRGKTELLPLFKGRGSRRAKQLWMCQRGAQFSVQLLDGRSELVSLTDSYVHLGSLLDSSGNDHPDIVRRASLAHEMVPGLRRLFRNDALTLAERVHLMRSMPMARFRHGCGLWTLDGPRERARFRAAYYEVPRRVFRSITGLSVRGASNDLLCDILGIVSAEEMRQAELVRHLGWILAENCPRLEALWLRPGAWSLEADQALDQVCMLPAHSPADKWRLLRAQPHLAGRWARGFLKQCLRRRLERQEQSRRELQFFQLALHHGCLFLQVKAESKQPSRFTCGVCQASFSTRAACAAHQRKVHQMVARATAAAVGTRCPVCGVEFWSTPRLVQHLRKHERCLTVVEAADLDPEQPVRAAARENLPAIRAPGPAPWWATLEPVPTPAPALIPTAPWRELLLQFVESAGSDSGALLRTVSCIVERRAFMLLEEEDWPVTVCRLPKPMQDLVHILTEVCACGRELSSGSRRFGVWTIFCKDARIVLWPDSFPLTKGGDMQLPTEWAFCHCG